MLYLLDANLSAIGVTFASTDAPAMIAVQANSGCMMKALNCTFRGWEGSSVVLALGQLEMDACKFTGG